MRNYNQKQFFHLDLFLSLQLKTYILTFHLAIVVGEGIKFVAQMESRSIFSWTNSITIRM